jgi:hypothetical protein
MLLLLLACSMGAPDADPSGVQDHVLEPTPPPDQGLVIQVTPLEPGTTWTVAWTLDGGGGLTLDDQGLSQRIEQHGRGVARARSDGSVDLRVDSVRTIEIVDDERNEHFFDLVGQHLVADMGSALPVVRLAEGDLAPDKRVPAALIAGMFEWETSFVAALPEPIEGEGIQAGQDIDWDLQELEAWIGGETTSVKSATGQLTQLRPRDDRETAVFQLELELFDYQDGVAIDETMYVTVMVDTATGGVVQVDSKSTSKVGGVDAMEGLGGAGSSVASVSLHLGGPFELDQALTEELQRNVAAIAANMPEQWVDLPPSPRAQPDLGVVPWQGKEGWSQVTWTPEEPVRAVYWATAEPAEVRGRGVLPDGSVIEWKIVPDGDAFKVE